MSEQFDVAIIGSGLVGAAIAFDLRRAGLKVVVLEAEKEVGAGASRTNSGMVHTGFDSKPGTLETRCIRRQSERWPEIFNALGIRYALPGALLLAKNEEEEGKLPGIVAQAQQNGVKVHLLNKAQTLERSAGAPAVAGILVPGEAITDPFEVVRGLLHGVDVRLGWKVSSINDVYGGVELTNGFDIVAASFAVNCAGLFADEILQDDFHITPRRGDFIVYPRGAVEGLQHVLLPVPNEFTKGVLIFPTMYGNICAGPTAEDSFDKNDWNPTREGIELLHKKAKAVLPALAQRQPIAAWAGLRTVGHPANYMIRWSSSLSNVLHVVGIRSTGLSACLGISEYVLRLFRDRGVIKNKELPALEPVPPIEPKPWWERHNAYRKVFIKP